MSATTEQADAVKGLGVEMGLVTARFANKWGAIRLDRFGERWRGGALEFGKTIMAAQIGVVRLLPQLDQDVSRRREAVDRPGTPEAKYAEALAIQFGVRRDFIMNWAPQLPKRRIEEFGHDVDQLINQLHALAERASVALGPVDVRGTDGLPPPPPI